MLPVCSWAVIADCSTDATPTCAHTNTCSCYAVQVHRKEWQARVRRRREWPLSNAQYLCGRLRQDASTNATSTNATSTNATSIRRLVLRRHEIKRMLLSLDIMHERF